MNEFFYNKDFDLGFVCIHKNASSSILEYIQKHGFLEIANKQLHLHTTAKFYYILTNPIDRFAKGLVQIYFEHETCVQINAIYHALAQIDHNELEKFLLLFLKRIPANTSHNRQQQYVTLRKQLGFREDKHTMLQTKFIQPLLDLNIQTIPVSIKHVSDFPSILWNDSYIIPKLNTNTMPNSQRLRKCVKKVLLENKNNGQLDRIWAWLQADIDLWNANISSKYMIDHHNKENITQ